MLLYTSRRERAETKREKSRPKGLTKSQKCDIIDKLASERRAKEKYHSGTLKIEQCNQRETLEDSVFAEEMKRIQVEARL